MHLRRQLQPILAGVYPQRVIADGGTLTAVPEHLSRLHHRLHVPASRPGSENRVTPKTLLHRAVLRSHIERALRDTQPARHRQSSRSILFHVRRVADAANQKSELPALRVVRNEQRAQQISRRDHLKTTPAQVLEHLLPLQLYLHRLRHGHVKDPGHLVGRPSLGIGSRRVPHVRRHGLVVVRPIHHADRNHARRVHRLQHRPLLRERCRDRQPPAHVSSLHGRAHKCVACRLERPHQRLPLLIRQRLIRRHLPTAGEVPTPHLRPSGCDRPCWQQAEKVRPLQNLLPPFAQRRHRRLPPSVHGLRVVLNRVEPVRPAPRLRPGDSQLCEQLASSLGRLPTHQLIASAPELIPYYRDAFRNLIAHVAGDDVRHVP